MQVEHVQAILHSADESLKTSTRILTAETFKDAKLKKGEMKYNLFDGDQFDYIFDLAPINEPFHDENMQFIAKPFRGYITWFSYTHHKEALAKKYNKNKRSNSMIPPSFSERPLDDTYTEVRIL